jgi:hypothetical protein
MIYAYFGHHKSASTWIAKIMGDVCSYAGMKHLVFFTPENFGFNLYEKIKQNKSDFISYVNADISYVKNLKNHKSFHVIRDPRDIVVSAYFSHLYSHETFAWPELIEHREELKNLSKEEEILSEIEFLGKLPTKGVNLNLFNCMESWDYSNPDILEIKFEDLIISPYAKFIEIFDFLRILKKDSFKMKSFVIPFMKTAISKTLANNVSFLKQRKIHHLFLLDAIFADSFKNLSKGRDAGSEKVTSHYRKGIAGDWKNHFTEKHKQLFKDRYGDLLVKLGYENSNDW